MFRLKVEIVDAKAMKKLALSFERKLKDNTEARMKVPGATFCATFCSLHDGSLLSAIHACYAYLVLWAALIDMLRRFLSLPVGAQSTFQFTSCL